MSTILRDTSFSSFLFLWIASKVFGKCFCGYAVVDFIAISRYSRQVEERQKIGEVETE